MHELARLLDEATDVVAICQHFLASLQAPGDLAFDQQAVADLPLFADVLSLTAQYVDLETVYCLLNLSKVILDTAPMAVTAEVSSNRVETFVVAQPAQYIITDPLRFSAPIGIRFTYPQSQRTSSLSFATER